MEETRNDVVEVVTDETTDMVNTSDVSAPEPVDFNGMGLIGVVAAGVGGLALAGTLLWKRHKKKKAAKKAKADEHDHSDDEEIEIVDGEVVDEDDQDKSEK